MSQEYLPLVMLGCLLVMVMSGAHFAFSLMFLAVLFGLLWRGEVILSLFYHPVFVLMQNEILIAAPLFIFMGCILERSGAAERLYGALYQLFGPLRGGLALTTVFISTLFAATTGVIAASVTVMGLVALPAMIKRGYDKGLATGSVAAGGTLGILIPPSVMLVLYGPMANISVARLFAGAYIPGLILSALYLGYIVIRCWRQPEAGPPVSGEERVLAKSKLLSLSLIYMFPILFLILAVMGSILGGIATPTEASAVGAFGAILIAIAYRSFNLQMLKGAIYETLKVTSMVFFILMGAGMFTSVFIGLGGGKLVQAFLLGLPLGKWFILAVMMFAVFIMGMFLDWVGILYLIVPTFMPVAASLGFDSLWFAMLIAVNLQMSFLTPPFAYTIFFVKGISPPEVALTDIYRGIVPFVILQGVGLSLCIFFPQTILWLPSITLGK